MYVLGIETSCDETAASVVKDGRKICSSIVSSSLHFHKKYGGIVPEIAFRKQLETITAVTDCAVKEAGINLKKIGLVSVTDTPGLLGSLVVGITFARAVSLCLNCRLIGVNHLHSHIYANFLDGETPDLPFVALVVSGGHTSLFYVKDFAKIEPLGSTQDDACGEAFDKVAKILNLGYPGGPLIERLAKTGNPKKIKFSCSNTEKALDFSFSGIKTAVLYYLQDNRYIGRTPATVARDIAASFQAAVTDALIKKSLLACELKKAKSLVIGGGVAANNTLRKRFTEEAVSAGIKPYFPAKELCMDNAAMVAGLGFQLFKKRGGLC
jgi:N6-L-threonylcarbamoyladenine synthase